MSLDPALRSRIDSLLNQHRVVLFMKGTASAPRCGFSAKAVGALSAVVDAFHTVDVLADGGAEHFAMTIRAIRNRCPDTAIEVLVPDFKGDLSHVDIVLDAKPDIFNHNVETIERLQKPVRVQARYDRSLSVLRHAKQRRRALLPAQGPARPATPRP